MKTLHKDREGQIKFTGRKDGSNVETERIERKGIVDGNRTHGTI